MSRIHRFGLVLMMSTTLVWGAGCSGPATPHPVESLDRDYCLSCHREGINGAPKTSHPNRGNCVHCHETSDPVPADAGVGAPAGG
jgi:hypothetical protein